MSRSQGHDDDLVHVWCCKDKDLGLCGIDIKGCAELEDAEYANDCIVCVDINTIEECKGCPLTLRTAGTWNGS